MNGYTWIMSLSSRTVRTIISPLIGGVKVLQTGVNCAFRDKSMKVGMQLEQVLRSIFGYTGISKINA